MEMIKNVLTSPWSVMTVSLLIGPILSYSINEKIQKNKINKDILEVNDKITVIIQNVILDTGKISFDVIESFRYAMSKRENIELEKIASVSELIDQTILKIYEANYVTGDKKNEISSYMLSIKQDSKVPLANTVNVNSSNNRKSLKLLTVVLSLYILMLSGIVVFVFKISQEINNGNSKTSDFLQSLVNTSNYSQTDDLINFLVLLSVTAVLVSVSSNLYVEFKRKYKKSK